MTFIKCSLEILLPSIMAASSEAAEFPPQIDKYRGIVEDAVSGCLSGAFASL
jgi:hypothetical protein